MNDKEIFMDIPDFEGMYQVSNFGRIKSCDRIICNGRFQEGKIMKQTKTKKGYLRIYLRKDGEKYTFQVHRLVAIVFIPNTENKPCIDHINGVKYDNRVVNLRWCTNLENVHYSMDNETRHIFTPEESVVSRKVAKLDLQGNEIEVYPSVSEAARKNGIKSATKISSVCNGNRRTAGGFKWEYRSDIHCNTFHKNMKERGISIPIYQCDISGNRVNTFTSISEAVRKTHIHLTCIMKSLRNPEYSFRGYTFRYVLA